MKPIFAAGILYQNLPLNADITFEAGMLDTALGEEQNLSGINGAPGYEIEIVLGYYPTSRARAISEMNGVAWARISSNDTGVS